MFYYINSKGENANIGKFKFADRFSENLARVIKTDFTLCFINTKGEEQIIPYKIDEKGKKNIYKDIRKASRFHNNRAFVSFNGETFAIVDSKGKIIRPDWHHWEFFDHQESAILGNWENARYNKYGIAYVAMADKFKPMNEDFETKDNGEVVIKKSYPWKIKQIDYYGRTIIYDDASGFSEGYSAALFNACYGMIDLMNGNTIIPFEFKSIEEYSSTHVKITNFSNKVGLSALYDYEENIPCRYNFIGPLVNGLAFYADKEYVYEKDNEKILSYYHGYLNDKGQTVIRPSFREANSFESEFAKVIETDNHILCTESGKFYFEYVERMRYSKEEDWFIVKKFGKYGIVDINGSIILDFEYEYLFNNNYWYITFMLNGKLGVLNENMEIIIPPIYDNISIKSEIARLFIASSDVYETWRGSSWNNFSNIKNEQGCGKYGLFNLKKNDYITDIEFTYISEFEYFDKNLAIVAKDNKQGLIDKNGNIILDIEYGKIEFFSQNQVAFTRKADQSIWKYNFKKIEDIIVVNEQSLDLEESEKLFLITDKNIITVKNNRFTVLDLYTLNCVLEIDSQEDIKVIDPGNGEEYFLAIYDENNVKLLGSDGTCYLDVAVSGLFPMRKDIFYKPSHNLIQYVCDNKWGYIYFYRDEILNKPMCYVSECIFLCRPLSQIMFFQIDYLMTEGETLIAYTENKVYQSINLKTGTPNSDNIFNWIYPMNYIGLAKIKYGEKFGLINNNGILVAECVYDNFSDFYSIGYLSLGYVIFQKGDTTGIIIDDGSVLFETQHDLTFISNSLANIYNNHSNNYSEGYFRVDDGEKVTFYKIEDHRLERMYDVIHKDNYIYVFPFLELTKHEFEEIDDFDFFSRDAVVINLKNGDIYLISYSCVHSFNEFPIKFESLKKYAVMNTAFQETKSEDWWRGDVLKVKHNRKYGIIKDKCIKKVKGTTREYIKTPAEYIIAPEYDDIKKLDGCYMCSKKIGNKKEIFYFSLEGKPLRHHNEKILSIKIINDDAYIVKYRPNVIFINKKGKKVNRSNNRKHYDYWFDSEKIRPNYKPVVSDIRIERKKPNLSSPKISKPSYPKLIQHDGLLGYCDENGTILIPCQYTQATPFVDGIAIVCDQENRLYFINTKGELLSSINDPINNFSVHKVIDNRFVVVKLERVYGYINEKQELIIPPYFCYAGHFINGQASVQWQINGKLVGGTIDTQGNIISIDDESPEAVTLDAEGEETPRELTPVERIESSGKYSFVDNNISEEGLILVRNHDGLYGFTDSFGNEVIPCCYPFATAFHNGLAAVSDKFVSDEDLQWANSYFNPNPISF